MTADPFERHTPGALLSVCTDDPPPADVRRVLACLAEAARAVVGPDAPIGFALADAPSGHRICRLYVTTVDFCGNSRIGWDMAIHATVSRLAAIVVKAPLPYPLQQRHALALARFWSAVVDVHARTGAP